MKFDEADETELPLVFDSWARSFQKSPFAGCIPNDLYPQVARRCASEIVDRGARVLVAYIELEEGRRVMGYSVSEPAKRILHWLFVKKDYRAMGVGKQLLVATCPGSGWQYTHRTRASQKFLGAGYHWSPELARIKG
jgi:GNAT superfamily N-acetyltransferase